MEKEYFLIEVKALAQNSGFNNVVKQVLWSIRFSEDGVSSDAFIKTDLSFDFSSGFIPSTELTKEKIIEWVLQKEGGQAFLDMLSEIHGNQIQEMKIQAELTKLDFDFITPQNELIVPIQNA